MSDIYTILEKAGFEATIGLEVHIQLNTATKIFSSDANGVAEEPNTHISPISLGLPGTLPVLNEKAIEKAILFGLAVGAEINELIHFDRKSYFYPDLPKGYQTTQDKAPICIGGAVEAYTEQWSGERVQLHHTHLEEDAGKSSHDNADLTNIDLNRAGSPLIEVVTNPCIRSGKVAAAFLQEVRRIVRFLDIGEANMEKGELRCDANISIKAKEAETLGNRVEIKNMNSFNHVRRAIDFELERQFALLDAGETVANETRTFEPSEGKTFGMRLKETLNDYRYFPCPDLPPVRIKPEDVAELEKQMKRTPRSYRRLFQEEFQLPVHDVAMLSADPETASFAERFISFCGSARKAANWIKGPIKAYCNEHNCSINELPRSIEDIASIVKLELSGELNGASAPIVFEKLMSTQEQAFQIAKAEGLLNTGDHIDLEKIVSDVLLSLPDEVEQYKKGKKQLFGLFMGEVKKKGGRNLDPKQIQAVLRKELLK